MPKFTAKQIRRFYALRKAKVNSKLKEKLRDDNATDVLKEILADAGFHLDLAKPHFDDDPSFQENIELLNEGINNLLVKLENNELKLIFVKK